MTVLGTLTVGGGLFFWAAIEIAVRVRSRRHQLRRWQLRLLLKAGQASRELRQLGRESRRLRIELCHLEAEREMLRAERQSLANYWNELRHEEAFIHVSEERCPPGNTAFVARVSHPNAASLKPAFNPQAAGAWRTGRLVLVWAPDQTNALITLRQLHPEAHGWLCGPIEAFKLPE